MRHVLSLKIAKNEFDAPETKRKLDELEALLAKSKADEISRSLERRRMELEKEQDELQGLQFKYDHLRDPPIGDADYDDDFDDPAEIFERDTISWGHPDDGIENPIDFGWYHDDA